MTDHTMKVNYMNTATRVISLLVGGLVFAVVTVILSLLHIARPWAWGMIAGSLAALLTCGVIVLIVHLEYRKICRAEERVEGEILCFVYAGVLFREGIRRAYLFLTADGVHLFLWDKRPRLETKVERTGLTVIYPGDGSRLILREEKEEDITVFGEMLPEVIEEMRMSGYRMIEEHREEEE